MLWDAGSKDEGEGMMTHDLEMRRVVFGDDALPTAIVLQHLGEMREDHRDDGDSYGQTAHAHHPVGK